MKVKGKENVWSIDNEIAKSDKGKEKLRRRKKRGGRRMKNYSRRGDKVMVSGSMLMEVETVLQTQVFLITLLFLEIILSRFLLIS